MDPMLMIIVVVGVAGLGLLVLVLGRRWGDVPPRRTEGRSTPSRIPLAHDQAEEVRRLLAQGRKIEAIKRVRQLTGMGLKEAKEYVESL